MTHHATASSAIFAIHVNAGLTTPGLKKVPMPGYGVAGKHHFSRDRRLKEAEAKPELA